MLTLKLNLFFLIIFTYSLTVSYIISTYFNKETLKGKILKNLIFVKCIYSFFKVYMYLFIYWCVQSLPLLPVLMLIVCRK